MDKKLRDAFELLTPSTAQSDAMRTRLEHGTDSKTKRRPKPYRYALTAATILLAVFLSGVGINAATNGKLVSVMKEVFGVKQEQQDITGQALAVQNRRVEVWAPELYGISERYLVFGTQRGIVIYDLKADGISATIDVQAVGCIYFNSAPKWTHVLVEGDTVTLFNSEQGEPFGSYYCYDLTGEGELAVCAQGDDKETLDAYYRTWLEAETRYTDTFTQYHDHATFSALQDSRDIMYSRRTVTWSGGHSFLTIEDNTYYLCTFTHDNQTLNKTPLQLESEGVAEPVVLPMFVYTGDDPAIAAICDWFSEEAADYAARGDLWVPAFVIHREVWRGDEYLVFGSFWSYGYQKNGTMMEVTCGGEMPACFHLRKTEDGYTVVSVDRAGDGDDYTKDIREFTRGYSGLYEKFMNDHSARQAEIAYMKMYVENNNLDIRYIKHYGWDPVPIFE